MRQTLFKEIDQESFVLVQDKKIVIVSNNIDYIRDENGGMIYWYSLTLKRWIPKDRCLQIYLGKGKFRHWCPCGEFDTESVPSTILQCPKCDALIAGLYVVCYHEKSKFSYCLNRNYSRIINRIKLPAPVMGPIYSNDTQQGWKAGDIPQWANVYPVHEFTGYWHWQKGDNYCERSVQENTTGSQATGVR